MRRDFGTPRSPSGGVRFSMGVRPKGSCPSRLVGRIRSRGVSLAQRGFLDRAGGWCLRRVTEPERTRRSSESADGTVEVAGGDDLPELGPEGCVAVPSADDRDADADRDDGGGDGDDRAGDHECQALGREDPSPSRLDQEGRGDGAVASPTVVDDRCVAFRSNQVGASSEGHASGIGAEIGVLGVRRDPQ